MRNPQVGPVCEKVNIKIAGICFVFCFNLVGGFKWFIPPIDGEIGGGLWHCFTNISQHSQLLGDFKHFYFPFHIWDVIHPIDELIFFKIVIAPPTRKI